MITGEARGWENTSRDAHNVFFLENNITLAFSAGRLHGCRTMRPSLLLSSESACAYLSLTNLVHAYCSFAFSLSQIVELTRAKPISIIPGKGFSLFFRVQPGAAATAPATTTFTVGGLLNRDEAYAIICRQANLPCTF